ncbi:MAG: aspartate aminotransferase family protein [Vicinamibacterales bacterium]|jgi:glutamate-1-semialdehyde 2,1-aminomutase|nr:aspartate aminotransferase family protein [Acidobacteriota bacterium]MDP6373269.1 aspartate aminotransferase family protein [Vicinamibacterales bacterium]MDP6608519.1 aspartate aminotransferase family protein [Vicinamibacterales bacterium]HAK56383.1 aspartate aminotransferase family protein [Acidobacteriota bacterium]|tara:strand:- start:453 stop:1784 length:1332 start_codon:yes stop_codon:yes gene_type:complete
MSYSTAKSKALFERAVQVMVEGGSSPSRGPANYGEYPLFIERGQGAHLFDADGNQYLDWMMAYGGLPHGHAHPRIVEAVTQAVATGALVAAATEIEIEVAEFIQHMVPSAERVRFANTGTEATMAAIRLARGYTGRPKFIKFEGHYHGWYDDFLVNAHPHPVTSLGHRRDPIKIADSSGLNRRAVDDTIVAPWNDLAAVERALETNRGRVAAIITEGIMSNMGVIPPHPGYLEGLRQLARSHDVLLILDETVTGFRIAAGGCQQHYGLDPDITTFGKALGCGLPVAAFVGRAEIMEALAWGGVLHYGTQNASRIGLFAARANLEMLTAGDAEAFRHTWRIGETLVAGFRRVFEETNTPAIVQGVGPMFQIMFTDRPRITDYREYCEFVDPARYRAFAHALFRHGIYMTPAAALHSVASVVHTPADVETTLAAARAALAETDAQ